MTLQHMLTAAALTAALAMGLVLLCARLVALHIWPESVGYALTALAGMAALSLGTSVLQGLGAAAQDRALRRDDPDALP